MEIITSALAERMRRILQISKEDVKDAVNYPHRNAMILGTMQSVFNVLRWCEQGQLVFVTGQILEYTKHQDQIQPQKIRLLLILALRDWLPAGLIGPHMSMEDILKCMADSFGMPLEMTHGNPPTTLYTGDWDGQKPRIHQQDDKEKPMGIFGAYDQDPLRAHFVWAPSISRYTHWYAGWIHFRLTKAASSPGEVMNISSTDEIEFLPQCIELMLPFSGMTTHEIRDEMMKADANEKLIAEGVHLRFFTKKVQHATGQERLVLIIVREESIRFLIVGVFPLRLEWIKGDASTPPLKVLEQLIERFGVEFDLAGTKGRLLLGKIVQIPRGKNMPEPKFLDTHATRVLVCSYTLPVPREQVMGNDDQHIVAICFAMDEEKYRQALKE